MNLPIYRMMLRETRIREYRRDGRYNLYTVRAFPFRNTSGKRERDLSSKSKTIPRSLRRRRRPKSTSSWMCVDLAVRCLTTSVSASVYKRKTIFYQESVDIHSVVARLLFTMCSRMYQNVGQKPASINKAI